jgi:hypothetical protein
MGSRYCFCAVFINSYSYHTLLLLYMVESGALQLTSQGVKLLKGEEYDAGY